MHTVPDSPAVHTPRQAFHAGTLTIRGEFCRRHRLSQGLLRFTLLIALTLVPALGAAQTTVPDPTVATQPQFSPRERNLGNDVGLSDAARPLGLPASHVTRPSAPKSESTGTTATVVRTATSLTAVVGLILLAAFVVRALARRQGGIMAAVGAGGRAPSGVVEVLARYPVARTQTLILLKLPRRVLVLSQTRGVRGASSLAALSEITDPEELADLVLKTRDAESQTLSRKFGSILSGEERGLARVLGAVSLPLKQAQRSSGPAPSPDRVELSTSIDRSTAKSSPAKRGYSDAPTPPRSEPAFSDAELQQRLAALRQLALERNRRAS